jgi:hypothetical protein
MSPSPSAVGGVKKYAKNTDAIDNTIAVAIMVFRLVGALTNHPSTNTPIISIITVNRPIYGKHLPKGDIYISG